jgi:RNA recognition motif-containing protein
MNIYIGNLSYSLRESELRRAFEAFGEVESAEIIIDRRTGRSRGYGFVKMPNDTAAETAIKALDGHELHGRQVRVDISRPSTSSRRRYASRNRASNSRAAVGNDTRKSAGGLGRLVWLFKKIFR